MSVLRSRDHDDLGSAAIYYVRLLCNWSNKIQKEEQLADLIRLLSFLLSLCLLLLRHLLMTQSLLHNSMLPMHCALAPNLPGEGLAASLHL